MPYSMFLTIARAIIVPSGRQCWITVGHHHCGEAATLGRRDIRAQSAGTLGRRDSIVQGFKQIS